MAIKVGDRVPMRTFTVMTGGGPKPKTTDELFKGKKVVLFAVPGAFTPTCSNNHLPGFVKNADAIKAKGIDTIAVTGVNDVFVMNAWKKASGGDAHRIPRRRQRRLGQGGRHHGGPDRARPRRAFGRYAMVVETAS
jgi:peroxiredoxin